AAAKKLIDEGDRLFGKKDYAGALERYQKAYEAFPSPKIYYPMAMTEEKLGKDLDAYNHYVELLKVEDLPAALKKEAQGHVDDVDKRLVQLTFDVKPAGASVLMDDVEIGTTPLADPVRLMPGEHTYAVNAQGYMPVEKTMTLQAGDRLTETM